MLILVFFGDSVKYPHIRASFRENIPDAEPLQGKCPNSRASFRTKYPKSMDT